MRVTLAPRVIVDQEILSGKPVIEGTRIPVALIVGQLGGGMTIEEVAEAYGITREDILAALVYAAKVVANEEIYLTG